jgi:hypothetical protein
MRKELLALMRRTGDPFTEAFANREDKALASAVITKLLLESGACRRRESAFGPVGMGLLRIDNGPVQT